MTTQYAVKVERLMEGPGPGEFLVRLHTADGIWEQVIVHKSQLTGDEMVAWPLERDQKESARVLVELPRETTRGFWRVWVDESQLVSQVA